MKDVSDRIIIMVTGTLIEPYDQNWKECEATWVPILRNMGYRVISVVGNQNITDKKTNDHIVNYYSFINENLIQFNTFDTKFGIYDKSIYLPIKWILEETDYQYYVRIDSDSFVHPYRFHEMISEDLSDYPELSYMGCCIPYRGWDENVPHKEWICDVGSFASGAGYIISRDAMKVAYEKMRITEPNDFKMDDWVLGRAMWENGIKLLHDSRILFESPYCRIAYGSSPIPYIGDVNSHLSIQHYMKGNMVRAMTDLGL